MNDAEIYRQPIAGQGIVSDTTAMSFTMVSEAKVGSLLALSRGVEACRTIPGAGDWDGRTVPHGSWQAWMPRRRSLRLTPTNTSSTSRGDILRATVA